MPAIRGLTVSVGEWYAALLAITLPRNMRQLVECWVITAPEDEATQTVARSVPGVKLHITDGFTRHEARFNKGLCIEECFSAMGREGWLAVWDADCLWPDSLPLDKLNPSTLYGAKRRILENPTKWHPDLNWQSCPLIRDGGPVGYFQLFHCDAPALVGKRPWYDVTFAHAGGGDAWFVDLFKRAGAPTTVLPVEVLHLGPIDSHWFGTSPEARDLMAKFVTMNGWRRAMARHDPAAAARAGELVERVEVPGYPKSDYELPFVKRAQGRRP